MEGKERIINWLTCAGFAFFLALKKGGWRIGQEKEMFFLVIDKIHYFIKILRLGWSKGWGRGGSVGFRYTFGNLIWSRLFAPTFLWLHKNKKKRLIHIYIFHYFQSDNSYFIQTKYHNISSFNSLTRQNWVSNGSLHQKSLLLIYKLYSIET